MNDSLSELKKEATKRGLAVDQDGNEFLLMKGKKHVGSLWYIEDYDAFVDVEPGGTSIGELLDYLAPKKGPEPQRVHDYRLAFVHEHKAPASVPPHAASLLLELATVLADKLAPLAQTLQVFAAPGNRKVMKRSLR